MLIVNDIGGAVVNFDQVAACSIVDLPNGAKAVVAFCNGSQTLLTAGDEDRLFKCLQVIMDAWRGNQKLLDLRDSLGQRATPPAGGGLVVPMAVSPEAMKAAEEAMRRMGNGGRP